MNYTPRYLNWIENRNDIDLDSLSEYLPPLISCFESALNTCEKATEEEQAKYIKVLILTDAYISALLFHHLGDNPSPNIDDDKLKALLSKAADLDF